MYKFETSLRVIFNIVGKALFLVEPLSKKSEENYGKNFRRKRLILYDSILVLVKI